MAQSILGAILFPVVAVGGVLFYLLFGAKSLEPPIHTDLSTTKLRALLGEWFSFGGQGSMAVISDGAANPLLSFRKVIRAPGDVELRWVVPDVVPVEEAVALVAAVGGSALPIERSQSGGPGEINLGESIDVALEVTERVLPRYFRVRLEDACRFHASGITLTARNGWTSTPGRSKPEIPGS